jgi:hypothetical protein
LFRRVISWVGIAVEHERDPMSMNAISNGTMSKRIVENVVTI